MADTPVPRKVAKRPSGNLLLQPMRCTKIVATLGPASWPNIRALITAGVNVFRINFSHAVYESTDEVIQNIREASAELGVPVAILGDLCGPKVRVGTFKDGNSIELTAGESVRVKGSETEEGEPGLIVTPILPVVRALDVGHRLLLDDGELHLTVTEVVDDTEVVCEVVVGGTLKQRKGINCPDVALDLSAVTDKDRADAEYILSKNEFDYIALSFVQRAQDVQDLIDFMDEIQGTDPVSVSSTGIPSVYRPKIIAKIEKPQALDNIGSILEVVDGIMVARGDLGIEYSLPKIPTAQKMLIQAANASGKPVITATQMLDSMIRNPIPTRAECTDVANAVLDGTDAVMLSGETAAGDYPIRAVEMMDEICRNVETLNDRIKREEIPFGTFGISHTATTAAGNVGAEAIVAITESGRLARRLSKARLTSPTFAYAHNVLVRNQLCLVWGVVARTLPAYPTTEETLCYVEDDLMGTGAFSGDSKIVYCAGTNHRVPAIENTVRVALLGRYKKSLSLRQAWKGAVDGALEAAHGSGSGGGGSAGSPGSSA